MNAPEAIEFSVRGDTVVGTLHRPASPPANGGPAVIVAGPMTSVKERVTGTYAAALARRGIAALAIDHRHFGRSGGQPRQYEHHGHKVEDLVAAARWLASQPGIDGTRLGTVGVCLGAGYAAATVLAQPALLRAWAGIAGYYRDPAQMRAGDPGGFDAKVDQGRHARQAYEATGELRIIPAAASGGDAAMQSADTVDYYTRRAAVPGYVNGFAVMSREHFVPFDVMSLAPRLAVPALMIHSENALSPPWARRFHAALPGPKTIEWVASAGQTDFYDEPALVEPACERVAAHLHATLR